MNTVSLPTAWQASDIRDGISGGGAINKLHSHKAGGLECKDVEVG